MLFAVKRFGSTFQIAWLALAVCLTCVGAEAPAAAHVFSLTVDVDGVRNSQGAIGMLVFRTADGWPDETKLAVRMLQVPAHAGRTVVHVDGLSEGDYGILVVHDENLNRKLDKDWKGLPKEQWGMSNNPRVLLTTPKFDAAKFHVRGDMEVQVQMRLLH